MKLCSYLVDCKSNANTQQMSKITYVVLTYEASKQFFYLSKDTGKITLCLQLRVGGRVAFSAEMSDAVARKKSKLTGK